MIKQIIVKVARNKLSVTQAFCFILGKIFLGLVQLPQYQKDKDYLPFLICAFLGYSLAYGIKLYSLRPSILSKLLKINIKVFIIWVVSILNMIFTFSLNNTLGWNWLQEITTTLCLILQTALFVILGNWRYMTKPEFIFYQISLAINILVLGIKTVIFIEFQEEPSNKDIILLNLTTQIALTIIIMDTIERSYERYYRNNKHDERDSKEDKKQLQLTMNV